MDSKVKLYAIFSYITFLWVYGKLWGAGLKILWDSGLKPPNA